jgi:hypothetical protein
MMNTSENLALRNEAQEAAQRTTRHIEWIGEERASTRRSDSPAKRIYRGVHNG